MKTKPSNSAEFRESSLFVCCIGELNKSIMCSSNPNQHNQYQSPSEQRLPPCVEAVLELDCPSNVVIAAYQQLQSEGYRDVTEPGNDAESGSARAGNNFITAALLLMTVDTLMKSDFAEYVDSERITPNTDGSAAASVNAAFFSSSAGVEGLVPGSDLQGNEGQARETPSRVHSHIARSVQQKAGSRLCGKSKASAASKTTATGATARAASSTQPGSSADALASTATIATNPAETKIVSATRPADVETGSTTRAAETEAGSTTRPAETEAGSTTRPAETETVSTTRPVEAETVPLPTPTPNIQAASVVTMPTPQTGTGLVQGAGTSTRESQARERTRRQLDRLRALRTENRRLKERNLCRQCRQRAVELTLLPCGHFCFCLQCGSSLHACPLCRKTILADVRTFVS